MYHLAFNGIAHGALPFVFLILRVAAGAFFVFSGYHKLTNKERHATLVRTLQACGIPCVSVMQWFVPSVEFFGGLGVVFGFLTPLASFGLFIICLVAVCTDGLKRIPAWHPIDKADYADDVLYLPEVLFLLLLLPFIAYGAGAYSLDAIISPLVLG